MKPMFANKSQSSQKTFAIEKAEAVRTVVLPLVAFMGVAAILGMVAEIYTVSSLGTAFSKADQTAFYNAGALGVLVVFVITGVAVLLVMRNTAHGLRLDDDGLSITKIWGTQRLSWNEVADVSIIRGLLRRHLYIRTWNGGFIQLSPPLPNLEQINDELRRHATHAVSAETIKDDGNEKARRQLRMLSGELQIRLKMIFLVFGSFACLAGLAVFLSRTVPEPSLNIDAYCLKQTQGPGLDPVLRTGKKCYVQTYYIENLGRDFNGLDVTISGTAVTSGALRNPELIFVTQENPRFNPQNLRDFRRIKVPISPDQCGKWHARIPDLAFKHKDNFFFQTLTFFNEMLSPGSLSEQKNELELFADIEKPTKATVTVDFKPIGYPRASTTVSSQITARKNIDTDEPNPSLTLPASYIVGQYPGALLVRIDCNTAHLRASGTLNQAQNYFVDQLKKNGWKTEITNTQRMLEVTARKGPRILKIDIMDLTPCNLNLDIRLWWLA